MLRGFGAEAAAAAAAPKSAGWGSFFTNLAQNAITGLVANIPAVKPPATTAAAAATPGVKPAASSVASAAKSSWPIMAVVGAGIAGLVGVIVMKKKRA